MTFRLHPLTGEPILFAPERASRPGAFGDESTDRCPFCPGHELDTPATIVAIGDPWRVRVFENKYPPVPGAEVIVESPEHDATFDRIAYAEEAVRVYVERVRVHEDAPYVALFKNQGPRSSASIPHIHSQVMPLPFMPPRVLREGQALARAVTCPLCAPAGDVIGETPNFLWIAPEGSAMPYQQWLVPKRHVAGITAFNENELTEMATLLQKSSKAMLTLGDSYNWHFMNVAHSYIELFPRLTTFGGFELGSGTFVQIVDPAVAAERLRAAASA